MAVVRQLPLPAPGPAPLTSPAALLWWQARRQQWLLVASIACGIVSNVAADAMPYALGRMLTAIHLPSGRALTVGDVPLVDLPLGDLRRQGALVTQEHHVFVGTVADNLRLARVEADDAELERAVRAADAWGWVDALRGALAFLAAGAAASHRTASLAIPRNVTPGSDTDSSWNPRRS